MQTLRLDYCHRPPFVTAQGVLWVLLGIALVAVSGMTYLDSLDAMQQQEEREDRLRARLDRTTHAREQKLAEAKRREPELKDAQAVLRRLSVPWEQVFGALEHATRTHRDRIRVLGVQPDVDKGLVLLSGEAKDFDELMNYLDQLGGSGVLTRVRLLNHQVQGDAAGRPIKFYAVAEWKVDL